MSHILLLGKVQKRIQGTEKKFAKRWLKFRKKLEIVNKPISRRAYTVTL